MATAKQISYINSLIEANRNVPYLNEPAPTDSAKLHYWELNRKEWIITALRMKLATIDDETDETIYTASLYTLEQLEAMRQAKLDSIEASVPTMDSKAASAAIDELKRMMGRR